VVLVLTELFILVGLWKMKKWAGYSFIGLVLFNTVLSYALTATWSFLGLLGAAVQLFFVWKCLPKMK
jgi:hypothetical protein